jgi:hypothetical protein
MTSSTVANTSTTLTPLQQLAAIFQQSGITPSTQANLSDAPASELPQNQAQQTPLQQGMVPPPQQTGPSALTKLATTFPGLAQSLGMGTQQSWDGQSPQTTDYEGIMNLLNGTTINGADQVTAQPSFLNSISRMLP